MNVRQALGKAVSVVRTWLAWMLQHSGTVLVVFLVSALASIRANSRVVQLAAFAVCVVTAIPLLVVLIHSALTEKEEWRRLENDGEQAEYGDAARKGANDEIR